MGTYEWFVVVDLTVIAAVLLIQFLRGWRS
jgi:hypothetical protein